jgi:hypothetical protein
MFRLVLRFVVAFLVLIVYCSPAGAHSQIQTGSSDNPGAGYTLVLVDSSSKAELAQTRDFITSQGGQVAIVLPPHAAWVGSRGC